MSVAWTQRSLCDCHCVKFFVGKQKSDAATGRSLKETPPYIMRIIPKSEVQVKCFADTGKRRGDIAAKLFADFRPFTSRKIGRKKVHEKSSTHSTRNETKLFHRETQGFEDQLVETDVSRKRW